MDDMLAPLPCRQEQESYYDYFVRLSENKAAYGLSWEQIAKLLNQENGNNFGECTYRKFFTAFQAGREYERKSAGGEIGERILCLSDFHYPFQLPIETFRQYRLADTLVLNGDLVDMQSISKFPKNYRISPMEEMIGCRQYLLELIEYIHPKKVLINKGNHEVRFGAYLARNLDGEMKELMPETALDLIVNDGFYHYDKRAYTKVWYSPIKDAFEDIEIIYTGEWWCKHGKTIFAHPLAYSSGILKTSEKAANYFYRVESGFDAIVLAHTHKLGIYPEGGVTLFEQGTCSDTGKLNYADGKLTMPQQRGFLYICHGSDGQLLLNHTKLVTC